MEPVRDWLGLEQSRPRGLSRVGRGGASRHLRMAGLAAAAAGFAGPHRV